MAPIERRSIAADGLSSSSNGAKFVSEGIFAKIVALILLLLLLPSPPPPLLQQTPSLWLTDLALAAYSFKGAVDYVHPMDKEPMVRAPLLRQYVCSVPPHKRMSRDMQGENWQL